MASPLGVRPCVAEAFDREADAYDDGFGANPVGLVVRHVVQERLLGLFTPGSHVLDLGCGTGEDALFLATRGVRVTGVDVAPRMVERARHKAGERGLADRASFECRRAEDVSSLGTRFDGAYSDFGALNCADLDAVGAALRQVLRAGAPVLISLLGPAPFPAFLRRRARPRVGGLEVPVRYPRASRARALLGDAFVWRRHFALGVLLPGPEQAGWVRRHPQLFGLLAIGEELVRGWPLLRGLGDHLVLEGARR